MSAFGGKADMTVCGSPLSRSLLGVKRTCSVAPHMSAYDPKRTSDVPSCWTWVQLDAARRFLKCRPFASKLSSIAHLAMEVIMSVVTLTSDGSFLSKHPLSLLSACWFAVTLVAGCHSALAQQSSSPNPSTPPAEGSAVLPVPQPQFRGVIGRKTSDSTPDFPKGVIAPTGAPNVLLIMTDDTGFGAAGTFGGPIPTPTLDRLATSGLKYNRFHTTALCSPTRAALLTGRKDRKSTRLNSSHLGISYAVFCLKK